MCPYYSDKYKKCKPFPSSPSQEYVKTHYCEENGGCYRDCPNYKQLCKYNNGFPPSPTKY